jgi:hypothetical protein
MRAMSKYAFTLKTRAGAYHADTLLGLAWAVFTHRLSHLRAGDGWID